MGSFLDIVSNMKTDIPMGIFLAYGSEIWMIKKTEQDKGKRPHQIAESCLLAYK
jgi:hypothetical protein